MKRYTRHKCQRQHKTVKTLARCMFPRAAWIDGRGPYACLAWCHVLTVMLFEDLDRAYEAKKLIDIGACGHACERRHEVVEIYLDPPRTRPSPPEPASASGEPEAEPDQDGLW